MMNRVKKGWILSLAVVLLMFVRLPVSHAAVEGEDAPGREVAVRVMSYNIHAGIGSGGAYDLQRIAHVIRRSGADLIGLQEVDVHWGYRSDFQNEIKILANTLDMDYFFAPIYNLDPIRPDDPRRQYGVAVLSRYPIIRSVNHEITRLSTQSDNPSPQPAPGFPEVLINVKGAKVSFYVTHLDYRADPAVRNMQVEDMLQIISENDRTQKILVGDMNAPPDAPELAPLFTVFHDTWALTHDEPGYTYSASSPVKKIDYVLAAPEIKVNAAHVMDTPASDHLPVLADVTLVRGP